jgi:cytoskeletal protein RodZ
MKTVGQILKDAREKKNISLEEAEKATKIRKKILSALETSDWKNLPSPTFVKGLLKNYGSFLKLDTRSLLAFFRREYEEPKTQKSLLVSRIKSSKFRFTPQIITTVVFVAIIITAGIYLFSQYRSFTAAPLLEVTEPSNNIKEESMDVNVVGKTYPDATLKINGQQVQLSPGGTFSVAVSLVEGINTIVITAENRFGKLSTEKRTVVVETKKAGVIDQKPGKKKVKLVLNIGPQSANVRIELDGKKKFEGVLVAGSGKEFFAEERVKIFTSNAGSTKVTFNGEQQVLGKEGEALEREFKKP